MNEMPKRHVDGSWWVACTKESPKKTRDFLVEGENIFCHVYHPDAKDIDGAQDSHWVCPHCGSDWWEEIDG